MIDHETLARLVTEAVNQALDARGLTAELVQAMNKHAQVGDERQEPDIPKRRYTLSDRAIEQRRRVSRKGVEARVIHRVIHRKRNRNHNRNATEMADHKNGHENKTINGIEPVTEPKSNRKRNRNLTEMTENGQPSPAQKCRQDVWLAYATAYKLRYGVFPPRNAKVNKQIGLFVDRVPMQDAPGVATHYLSLEEPLYVRAAHPVDLMLRDAEKLYMALKTKRTGVATAKPWWETWHGIEEMGRELGVPSNENPRLYKVSVLASALASGRLEPETAARLGLDPVVQQAVQNQPPLD